MTVLYLHDSESLLNHRVAGRSLRNLWPSWRRCSPPNPKVRYGESAEIDTRDVQRVLLGQQTQIGYFFVSQEGNNISDFLVQQILDFAIKNTSAGSWRRC